MSALTCNETEALLQVKYNITEDEWNSSRPPVVDKNRALLYLQGNEIRYENFASVQNYEACLPRDECSQIAVGGLPTDAYKLSFDGKAVDIGHEFFFDGTNPVTSTTVGTDCTKPPICKDTEALLEIHYWSGSFYYNLHYFRVEDKDGGKKLEEEPEGLYSLNQTFACLPKDDSCYTFLIGGENQWATGRRSLPPPSYSIIYDGELVGNSDSWLFDKVRFGGSCEPLCNQDDESLIEFFMHDRTVSKYEYKWDLNITDPSSSETVSSGVVPMGGVFPRLAHEIMCVPKGSCASFYITAPDVATLSPVYSLTMDNVTYRKIQWFPDPLSVGSDNPNTNMGSCDVEGLCNAQTQDLFDLRLRLLPPATHEWPAIDSWDMKWNFGYTEYEADDWRLQYLLRDSYYNNRAYELDSSYGVIECVPNGGCDLSFNMTPGSPIDSYTVKKNGIQLDHSRVGDVLMTPFGENCSTVSNSLSGGAIAGIVVACVVAVGAIAFGLVWYKRRQAQSSSKDVESPKEEVAEGP